MFFPLALFGSSNIIGSLKLISLFISHVLQQTSQPSTAVKSEKPTTIPSLINETSSKIANISTNVTNINENTTSTQPASWYNYFSSSKPSYSPTNQPSAVIVENPTLVPTIEPSDSPTYALTEKIVNSVTSSNDNQNNYELISSMAAILSIIIIAVAFFITKKHLVKKKKHRTNVVFRSPLLFDMSKRAKQRKKLMEDYFEVEATENALQHRSAASSLDHQISTEFIDITRENQQSIY